MRGLQSRQGEQARRSCLGRQALLSQCGFERSKYVASALMGLEENVRAFREERLEAGEEPLPGQFQGITRERIAVVT